MSRHIILAVIVAGFIILGSALFYQATLDKPSPREAAIPAFTKFDVAESNRLMDENGDGGCDDCGMQIKGCTASGQVECSMKRGPRIGILGSATIKVRLAVEAGGRSINLSARKYQGRSAFAVPDPQRPGAIVVHATDLPLDYFLRSLEFGLDEDGLSLPDGTKFRNIKLYVNDKPAGKPGEYLFTDGDKIRLVAD